MNAKELKPGQSRQSTYVIRKNMHCVYTYVVAIRTYENQLRLYCICDNVLVAGRGFVSSYILSHVHRFLL